MSLTAQFFAKGNDLDRTPDSPETAAEVERLVARFEACEKQRLGVAALPRRVADSVTYYLFAWDERAWRELPVLVRAWLGPALTDVDTRPGVLDRADEFDDRIVAAHGGLVLKVGAPILHDREHRRRRRDRLNELLDAIASRPPLSLAGARGSAVILMDLGLAAAAGNHDRCRSLLDELADTGELDEANLLFTTIRVLATLGDWAALLQHPDLKRALQMRRPPGVSRAIQDAAYNVHLAAHDASDDDAALLAAFYEAIALAPGLADGVPEPVTRGQAVVQYLHALTLVRDPKAVERAAGAAGVVDATLEPRLRRLPPLPDEESPVLAAEHQAATVEPDGPPVDPAGALERARRQPTSKGSVTAALVSADVLGTAAAARGALEVVEAQRDDAERIATNPALEGLLARLRERGATRVPAGWLEWFGAVRERTSPGEAARWLEDSAEWSALPATTLIEALSTASDAVLRILPEAAGPLMNAHLPTLHELERHRLRSYVLTGLALGSRVSGAVLDLAYALLEDATTEGAPQEDMRNIVEALGLLVAGDDRGFVPQDWAIDVLEAVGSSTANGDPSVLQLEQDLQQALRRAGQVISPAVNDRWKHLAATAGLAGLPPDLVLSDSEQSSEALGACLAGRSIGIYTLAEPAGHRAAAHLRRRVDRLEATVVGGFVADDALKALAESCDLLVVVIAAAKHAATDYLRSRRGSRPLVTVGTRGTTAILRAVEAYCEERGEHR